MGTVTGTQALSRQRDRAKIDLSHGVTGYGAEEPAVPLSEDEQRIYAEIERSFYDSDPEFAERIAKSPNLFEHASRNMKLAGLGFLAGLAFLILTLAVNPFVAFAGFGVMVGCALVFANNMRRAGRAGIHQLNEHIREKKLGESLASTKQRLRERFKREE